jgi:hypothetical protein
MMEHADDIVSPCPLLKSAWRRGAHLARRLPRFGRSRLGVTYRLTIVIIMFIIVAVGDRERIARDVRSVVMNAHDLATISPPLYQSLEYIEAGNQGFHNPTVHYPDDLIGIILQSDRQDRDILSGFEALNRSWQEKCPTLPLTITFVYPPVHDPCLQGAVPSWPDRSEIVEEENFERLLPLLRDIRDLIRESNRNGSGSGSGRLFISGYPAAPEKTSVRSVDERPKVDSAGGFDRGEEIVLLLSTYLEGNRGDLCQNRNGTRNTIAAQSHPIQEAYFDRAFSR